MITETPSWTNTTHPTSSVALTPIVTLVAHVTLLTDRSMPVGLLPVSPLVTLINTIVLKGVFTSSCHHGLMDGDSRPVCEQLTGVDSSMTFDAAPQPSSSRSEL